MKKVWKVGIIGACANRAMHAFQAHQPENGVEVVMGADPMSSKRIPVSCYQSFQDAFPGVPLVKDYKELIANPEIDIVFIMSPDYCHEEQAVAALEAGKAVYLEKPLAISIEGCDRILRTAYKTRSKLFLGHNMRYFPVVLKMKEVIDSGLIGEVQCGWCRHFIDYGGDAYFKDWHSEQRYTNGLLLQKGAHDIDVMHWLMGTRASRVVGMGMLSVYNRCDRRESADQDIPAWEKTNYPPLEQKGFSPVIDIEDHNMILMQMENGTQASYMQCHYTPDSERNYTFIGTHGRVENVGDSGHCQVHVWTNRGERANPDIIYDLKAVEGTHGGADGPIVQNFLDFVRFGAETNANPLAARDAVAAGVLGHASMRNGNVPFDIPRLEPEIEEYFRNGQK